MGVLILCAVLATACLAAWVYMQVEDCRFRRRAVVAERESAERFEASRDDTEAAMSRSAGRVAAWPRLPKRPVELVAPECLGEAEVAKDANLLIAAATRACRAAAELRENAALMAQYTAQYPIKQRPSLVERQAVSDNNPQVETS